MANAKSKHYINTRAAMEQVAAQLMPISRMTMVTWARKYKLGVQTPSGRWCISKKKLQRLLEAKNGS